MAENSMFLSQPEIQEMTGFRSRTCQIRWCNQNGIVFRQRADASLVILREHVREVLGGLSSPQGKSISPDFSSLT